MFVKATLTALTALTLSVAVPAFAADYTAGEAQLAYAVGVEPGVYTVAELITIRDAQWENDFVAEQHRLNRVTLSTSSSPSQGAKQLAAIEGLSAHDYSLSQIIRISDASFENDLILEQHIKAENRRDVAKGISAGRVQLAASLGVNPADHTLAELVHLDTINDPRDNHKN